RRVYVDVMQNARGRHAVPPYVLRAVPQATVSTPLEWRELTEKLDPADFNIKTIFRRLARQKRDLFAPLAHVAVRSCWRLKNWTGRSGFGAAAGVLKVPRFRRLPVLGSSFRE